MTVAVGFSPRRLKRRVRVAERRLNAVMELILASLRDARLNWTGVRGLKPTATVRSSLREANSFDGYMKLRCAPEQHNNHFVY